MAYPIVCDPCLEEEHDHCVETIGHGFGVGFCICTHGPRKPGRKAPRLTPWEEKVRETSLKSKSERDRRAARLKEKCG